jgi:lipid A disaccharide synthetase
MTNKIELLSREEANKLSGTFSKSQRMLVITGSRCDEIDLWLQECASDFDTLVNRNKDGNKIICLIVPEFCASQAESDIFNKAFMHFKLAWSNDFGNWEIVEGFKAEPTSRF